MSTKAIRYMLKYLEVLMDAPSFEAEDEIRSAVKKARAELEAIEAAARELDRLSMGDFVTSIRDRGATLNWASETGKNSWLSPDVRAWNDAAMIIERIAEETK